jgi:ABC-type phosphate transport system permease subunit
MAVKNQEEVHLYNITTPVETITSVISSAMTHKEQQLCAFITVVLTTLMMKPLYYRNKVMNHVFESTTIY